jgi:signal transduction histidine kinase/ActR/RegA family two-component response regulator
VNAAADYRLLLLTPTGRDAANTRQILQNAGLQTTACASVDQLCSEIGNGAGAVLLTEEAFAADSRNQLAALLCQQPGWSDLPFVILSRGGPDSPAGLRALNALGNVISLERPVRISTLVAAAKAALRQRTQQYRIRRQLNELEEADHRKDEFLAMLAHELRNPLAPIRNGVQLLQRSGSDGQKLGQVTAIMERQIHHLSRLVDDLLDVSRITRGKISIRPRRLQFSAAVTAAVETSRPRIDSRRQHLHVNLPQSPLAVSGDETRLAQVISNLLNNASKYTPDQGNIWLSVAAEGRTAVLRVRDDGIGIPAEKLGTVFELFMQVDSSLARSQGGLGLGLTLARSIVEMHGGNIEAASGGADCGSEFTVRLPLAEDIKAAAPAPARSASQPHSSALRILVVDDNHDAAESLAMLLQQMGHEVHLAFGGEEALATETGFRPEVFILDIGLPRMDGYELARRLREREESGKAHYIALSGYAQEENRRKALAGGFDHYMIKPLEFDRLLTILHGYAKVAVTH